MFRFFSCFRSSNVHSSQSTRRNGYAEQAEFLCDAGVRVFKLGELIVATDKFSPGRVLNEGKLGRVYKGILKDGKEVAVKCLLSLQICLGELNLHLHDLKLGKGKKPLDWKTRMKIAEGVARALEYLHDGMNPTIIYYCLEVSKILLDENYNPKLSDFGCAENAIPVDHCRVYTKPAHGYVSPDSRARPMLRDIKKFPEIADPLMERQYPYSELAKMCTTRT
ncbi:hypothetical protein MKW98_026762 [Papaver atlanticum]|uniref:Protein kinase domain-containing protein n=1 Tax=Papaver atlanticum TaxID=357466 RepID=A0AAD4RZT3_9MAGN|nr:hypothetical protein MKW98_026762 [Papaver atlanticum]